jgi:hypothetical protein
MQYIRKLRLAKAEQNGVIGATDYYHVLAKLHQLPNELVNPDNFRF